MTRHQPPTRDATVAALFAAPQIWQLAVELEELPGHRRRLHPTALHLAYGSLARLYRSQNRLDAELAGTGGWSRIVDLYNTHRPSGAAALALHAPRLTIQTYRHFRHWVCAEPERLDTLVDTFTATSVTIARSVGLLDPNGPGSITRPHPTRTIYGDGTIVRPIYSQSPTGLRIDHDAAAHTRHDGTIIGNNLVHFAVRGPEPQRRVILAVGRAPRPGTEAATAVDLVRRIYRYAPDAIQAVVYDGAFRGVHHDTLMSEMGLLVINRVHPFRRDGDDREWRPHLLGTWTHTHRRTTCGHTLLAHRGAICDSHLDDTGHLALSEPLPRRQVRRYPRKRKGGWRFSLGVEVACPLGSFTAWISPHATNPTDTGRPDQIRLLPEHDPLFLPLYGLRNDAESINANYKRTLPVGRAPALGWRRQVIDLLSWSLLTNSVAWTLHQRPTVPAVVA